MDKKHAGKLANLVARDLNNKLYDAQLLGSLHRLLEHVASIIVEKPIVVQYVEKPKGTN